MTITATRRGFLAGLLGTSVIAVLPKLSTLADAAPVLDPYEITAPSGWTYQWVASHVMGEPTERHVQDRLDSGWTFVPPSTHPSRPSVDIEVAVAGGGLILMQKETRLVALPGEHPMTVKVREAMLSSRDDGGSIRGMPPIPEEPERFTLIGSTRGLR